MSNLEITEVLLSKIAGWEPVKQARGMVAAGRVLNSEWQPPLLRGTVQEGKIAYRAGLKIKSGTDAENLCTCRQSRQWGTVCAHSVAVGIHYINSKASPRSGDTTPSGASATPQPGKPTASAVTTSPKNKLQRARPGEKGIPSELFLILPPNPEQALARGQVMVCLEIRKDRGARVPLGPLSTPEPLAFPAEDDWVLDFIESLDLGVRRHDAAFMGADTSASEARHVAQTKAPSCRRTPTWEPAPMLMLDGVQFAGLLEQLAGHPRVSLGKTQPVEIATEPIEVKIAGKLEPNGEISLRSVCPLPASLAGRWTYSNRSFRPLPPGTELLRNGPRRIPRSQVPQFLTADFPRLAASGNWEGNFAAGDFILEQATPQFSLLLEGSLNHLEARPECLYGERKFFPGAGDLGAWFPDPHAATRYFSRNAAAERNALERLFGAGFQGPDAAGRLVLKGQNPVLSFFAREYPLLQKQWQVKLEEKLQTNTQRNLEWVEPRYQITPSGEQWFDLQVEYSTKAGERFSPADIQRLLLSGQNHSRLKSGKFALLDTGAVEELEEVLLDCAPRQHAGSYRINHLNAAYVESTLGSLSPIHAPSLWKEKTARQTGAVQLPQPALGQLDSILRPYQKEGVAWLSFLRQNHFGGILADEMGLGKTLQVLALFASHRPAPNAPRLVVCPTSLVSNWAAEAAKFTPDLRVLELHGPQRKERFGQIASHDLVITSYALLRRDAEVYRGIEFDTVVLDEAQHIKNRQTQNAQAVKTIRANNRLVLTGTPLENSVLDLWSIFDFLMPGYLGTAKDFRERYEQPITTAQATQGSSPARERLARRLRPFLLRRMKREVATDLPEKIEQVSYCELNEDQQALYQQVLNASRNEILSAVQCNGLAKSRMVVLTALLRLRQICCDLRLLSKEGKPLISTGAGKGVVASGKLELFGELLEEVIDGGHRVLVFSQFTSMLALLKEHLSAREIEFCYLDGSTKERAQVVENFQRDPKIPVFLISLKAGGVGLNLTAADTVIHFDPWWNPAVEAQATDRAHRIGQRNVVTSYKLITRGTVEEKILNLQNRKQALLQGMLQGEEELAQSLSWEEIQDLLTV